MHADGSDPSSGKQESINTDKANINGKWTGENGTFWKHRRRETPQYSDLSEHQKKWMGTPKEDAWVFIPCDVRRSHA
jgi:hypothetical protein